ncbi:MAG: radical SAM protein [Proteobacteria bacterium]|nr:radical SAM protein [Pseudomonadota bacterium]
MNRRTRYFLEKVLTSPRHLLNTVLVMLSFKLRLTKVNGQPLVLDLEPSNTCNFHCPHCDVTYAAREKKALSLTQYKVIMNSFPYALRVKLQGDGEPFTNKLLYQFIEDTCLRGAWCEVVTNGSILDRRKLRAIKRFKNFKLTVSFDAADKVTFEKIRPGSNFEKILENIGEITDGSAIDVAALMLLQEENKDQMEGVIRLLAEKGVKSLGLQSLFFDFDKEREQSKIGGKWVKQDLTKNAHVSLKKYAKRYGVQLNISDKLYSREQICPWPWMGAFVDASGNVVPCCRIGNADVCDMGNLSEKNFNEIWNSKAYKDFRLRHKINDLPEFCSGCYSDVP